MPNKLSHRPLSIFEQIKQTDQNGNEFWGARKLAKELGQFNLYISGFIV